VNGTDQCQDKGCLIFDHANFVAQRAAASSSSSSSSPVLSSLFYSFLFFDNNQNLTTEMTREENKDILCFWNETASTANNNNNNINNANLTCSSVCNATATALSTSSNSSFPSPSPVCVLVEGGTLPMCYYSANQSSLFCIDENNNNTDICKGQGCLKNSTTILCVNSMPAAPPAPAPVFSGCSIDGKDQCNNRGCLANTTNLNSNSNNNNNELYPITCFSSSCSVYNNRTASSSPSRQCVGSDRFCLLFNNETMCAQTSPSCLLANVSHCSASQGCLLNETMVICVDLEKLVAPVAVPFDGAVLCPYFDQCAAKATCNIQTVHLFLFVLVLPSFFFFLYCF
jgi:hypothetical protein